MRGVACRCGGIRINGECSRCGAKRGHRHESSTQRGYDSRWKALSLRYRANHPLCEHCELHGRTTPATEVHHKVPVKIAPRLRLQADNLIAVCRECHEKLEKGSQTPPP